MPNKGKRATIKQDKELEIMDYALNTEYRTQTRVQLAEFIREKISWQGKAPEIEVLERKISWYRNHSTDNPQDKPWSIATLDTFPISPQAFPIVLKEYKRHRNEGTDFTIRQAKWINRLSVTQYSESLPSIIARTEQMYEILGQKPDFEIFDKLLAGLPGESDNWRIPFYATASLAGILKNDPTKKAARGNDKHD